MTERVSLTKEQRESGIGAELLVLCQGLTQDGTLSLDEIKELVRWLRDNRDADLPAKDFLAETVNRIIADRRVTREEQKELYRAIEVILPPDARKAAASQRREFEAELKHRQKVLEEAEGDREREERERSTPIATADFMVAGVHYEGRGAIIAKYVSEGDRAYVARDWENRFSPHAVEVRTGMGFQVGFVPEQDNLAAELAACLEAGYRQWACFKKLLRGGRVPIPVVLAYFYRPDAVVEGATFPDQVPSKAPPRV